VLSVVDAPKIKEVKTLVSSDSAESVDNLAYQNSVPLPSRRSIHRPQGSGESHLAPRSSPDKAAPQNRSSQDVASTLLAGTVPIVRRHSNTLPGTLKKRNVAGVVVCLASGLIATMAIPAYADSPDDELLSGSGTLSPRTAAHVTRDAIGRHYSQNNLPVSDISEAAQSFLVSPTVAHEGVRRENYAATSADELARINEELDRLATVATPQSPSSSLPARHSPVTTTDLSPSAIYDFALRYLGVPYATGGSNPDTGFDCSGFVMYVFQQFGISLPHSVSGQAAAGRIIPSGEAQPGDLVIMSGHNGFYAGNGQILDAPDVGRSVTVRNIWASYYIVRIGP
jgi:peptidoglycan DL-endopeptidase CwlO